MVKTFGNIRSFVLLALVLFAAPKLAAQDEGAGIYRVEGTDFALTMNGARTVFPADSLSGGAMPLERSGIVHTGPGTFLELQLLPSGTVIKLAENTSFVYNGLDETGKFADLGLLYGRIRVVTGTGSGAENSVVIRGGGVSARVETGDFGVDYVLDPFGGNSARRPLFRVFVFRGGAELFPYGKGGNPAYFGGTESIAAEEGECLSVDVSSGYTFAERGAFGEDITAYWRRNNFAGISAPLPMPDTEIAAIPVEVPPESAAPAPPAYTGPPVVIPPGPLNTGQAPPAKVSYLTKNLVLGVGLTFTLASVAAQAISYSRLGSSNRETANAVFTIAYGPLGFGLLTLLGGILYNPRPAAQ